ncbi:MAG: ABC transporter ATP-binding protein [Gammaproteobacteria bacterium]|nr:ABC transporter ATP-binding protein [Gammaproteobacteria bacterium]MCD8543093.1 ABC transporter ATP-binding protein [Gammaproteobacteria bacterium]MCD8573717.1 ABC transporter ATP-binding protein [Gammaproteobacteria bacterium]
MSSIILSAANICKSYHEMNEKITVLKEVNLTVHSGEMIAIIGASGSGKSTLLHILGGLASPDSGVVLVENQNMATMQERQRCHFRNRYLGFIYQFHHLLPEFSILDNVCMPLWIGGVSSEHAKNQALDMLERVGLTARRKHRMAELSGGERQRAAIARALVTGPRCILADELTGNLDHATALNIVSLMKELTRETQAGMILVTHDLSLAAMCHQRYTLRSGELLIVE